MVARKMTVNIEQWVSPQDQSCRIGQHHWSVSRLHQLARDLPVMEVPMKHLGMYYTYNSLTLREMVMHMKAAQDSDLSFPIILDEDGELMDGRHRLMKAMLLGHSTIKVVRFDKNPAPCKVED
jgi:hypothetical protein